eukprot:CAMPEP_0181231972 /NCGR_PEP_ID=MMETSP1096-20121128/35435_1 /TAXON_ID=156174 ORGANISM="Chrysochromulina ericina, Strain CCMP281" /NCGR_SAMPLE_ID=MMETSP1096 /ASSEMBLY_ACC=CAM_ASM_000453 /LENGTH=46 /DNA_ID= /DNA_START= /DNA_END= /DNA_ORIENTATION=
MHARGDGAPAALQQMLDILKLQAGPQGGACKWCIVLPYAHRQQHYS